jgi:HJR/Mrr/RecB family endonuclease
MSSVIADVDEMDGRMFELLLLKYFHMLGYKAKVTRDYADYGADLLLVKDKTKMLCRLKA